MRRSENRRLFLAIVFGGVAGTAFGQDAQPVDSFTSAEMFEMNDPPDLPGHERGARTPAERTPTEEPAPEAEARDWFGGQGVVRVVDHDR